MTIYRFHWKGSKAAVLGEGSSAQDAFASLGYAAKDAAALDYFEEVTAVRKMTIKQFVQWEVDYRKLAESRHLRFGQAFLNHNYPHLTDAELYNEPSEDKARSMIIDKYINLTDQGGDSNET